jgi:uncharacterized protein YktA (UPF0223 family)
MENQLVVVLPQEVAQIAENVSVETFEMFFAGIERAFNDKIEAEKKAEAEKAKLEAEIKAKSDAEEKARWKEETKERFEAEQKELKVQQRMINVAKFVPDMPLQEFENMSDEMFVLFLSGIEKAYNDKIEAEKKAKNAPDKTKLIELAAQIDGLNMPEIKGEEAQKILSDVKILLSKVSVFIREKSSVL